jgi:hypothetical protein
MPGCAGTWRGLHARGSAGRLGPFTDSLPLRAWHSPRIYQAISDDRPMADFLVIAGIVIFVAAMLGLIWGLERV